MIEVTENKHNVDKLSEITQNGKTNQNSTLKIDENIMNIVTDMEIRVKKCDSDDLLNDVKFHRSNSSSSVVSQISNISSTMGWIKMRRFSKDTSAEYATSGFEQFKVLLMRMLLQISRNRVGKKIMCY